QCQSSSGRGCVCGCLELRTGGIKACQIDSEDNHGEQQGQHNSQHDCNRAALTARIRHVPPCLSTVPLCLRGTDCVDSNLIDKTISNRFSSSILVQIGRKAAGSTRPLRTAFQFAVLGWHGTVVSTSLGLGHPRLGLLNPV